MADFFESLFGQTPDYSGGLAPEQMDALKSNAAKNALLASAVTMLGMSGQQPRPISTGQALGAALGAGFGGYQSSFDNTLKQMLAAQQLADYRNKAEARARYDKALAGATALEPQAVQMATTPGSQLEMLSRPEFGGDMAGAETVSALKSNLPMVKKVNQDVANQAAMDYLRSVDPGKYLELTAKQDTMPSDIRSAIAYMNLPPEQQAVYRQLKELGKPGGISLTLNTEKTFGGALGTKIAEQDADKFSSAIKAPAMLSNINATRELLDKGNVITGAFADEKLNIARVGQALGVTGKGTDDLIANTQTLFANRAGTVLDSIKASGLGAGQGFSNADRDYLEKAKMGGIKFSTDAMKKQLDIEEKAARALANNWNERYDQMPDSAKTPLGLTRIELPSNKGGEKKTGVKKYNPATGKVE